MDHNRLERAVAMWVDYGIAASIGFAGLLGLVQLTGELNALSMSAYQLTMAGFLLDELAAQSSWEGVSLTSAAQLCGLLEWGTQALHCGMAEAWLAVLPQGSLSTAVDGSVSLTWQQMDGSAIGVTRSDASE
jgi:hypothetical protein